MKIKPTYPKTYIIRYKRGNDIQTTEVVEAKEGDVHDLIARTFKGRFKNPQKGRGKIPATQIQVIERDNEKKTNRVSCFSYIKDGKCFEHQFAYVHNLSPRAVRIELEKAIMAS